MATTKDNEGIQMIVQAIKEYTEEITEDIKEEVKKEAEECVRIIEQKINESRIGGKIYRKSWRYKIAFENQFQIRCVVYSTKPMLTHLLEYGHLKVLWGKRPKAFDRVEGIPHIRPAEQEMEQRMFKYIRRKVAK